MRRIAAIAAIVIAATGCSRVELVSRGFILGVAIDLGDRNQLEVTSQLYKPSSASSSGDLKQTNAFVNITTHGDTIFEAVRDITIHLGRKAQWSHVQLIAVSENVLKEKSINELLDFFYRDHETRLTTKLVVTRGAAKQYLDKKAYMENTISRQIHNAQRIANRFSGKALEMNLLKLIRQLKRKGASTVLPYAYFMQETPGEIATSGGAVVKNGRMIGTIGSLEVSSYLLLSNSFQSGILVLPCGKDDDVYESFEVDSVEGRLKSRIVNDKVAVTFAATLSGKIGEMTCSHLQTPEDYMKYQQKISTVVTRRLEQAVKKFQADKTDILGIGNEIFKRRPALWRRWSDTWDERFQRADFTFDVKVMVLNSGLEGGKSFYHLGEEEQR